MGDPSDSPTAADQARPVSEEVQATAARMGAPALALEAVEVTTVAPGIRRIGLVDPRLADVEHHPGQDLTLSLPAGDDRTVKRRYTVRTLDRTAARADIDVVLHGDGPGARWAAAVAPGDRIEGIGPRGKIWADPGADWHLFVGDESYLPATFAMCASRPAGRTAGVVLEHDDDLTALPLTTEATLQGPTWVQRNPVGSGERGVGLVDALARIDLPAGTGHGYVGGEAHAVRAVRAALIGRGVAGDAISAKAYWRAGAPNAEHGEPTRD
jgi:NADPH-dependent ferric siderophore reductase